MKNKIKYEYLIAIIVVVYIIGMIILARTKDEYKPISNSSNVYLSDSNALNNNEISSNNDNENIESVDEPIEYTIIKLEKLYNIKASVDVRIKKELYKSEIEKIAYKIKESLNKEYERIFICYYLPGMKVGELAWATSHFNPDIEITMTSPFFDDSKTVAVISDSKLEIVLNKFFNKFSSAKIIGKWNAGENNIFIFFKLKGKAYSIAINIDNYEFREEHELITKSKNGHINYIIKDLTDIERLKEGYELIDEYTDYYKIEDNGDLSFSDKIGLIERYIKI